MVKRLVHVSVTGLMILAGIGAASGAPIATLTFMDPFQSVNPADSIPVWLTLALDPASDPLITDAGANVTSGLTVADVQANLFSGLPAVDPTTDTLTSNLNVGFGCSGTFTSSCTTGPPYDFIFNFNPPTLISPANLNLPAGSSTNFLYGTFVPTGGIAPPGTYQFFFASVFIQVFDQNFLQDPSNLSSGPLHIADVPIADTAESNSVFTRSSVPEPGTYTLMLAGLGALVAFMRRKA
jgi:hypothetical protein